MPSTCTYPATDAKICATALQTVILPLIASVFYHDALLSPAGSLGSGHKGLLSASGRVWRNTHGPASLSWTLLRQTGHRAKDGKGGREGERERWSSLPLSTDHNTRCWWHAMPSPPALALGCISHYLHYFRCCNQQMEQPPWKVFLSFWANPSKVKGRKKTRQEDRMKKKKSPPVLLTCMERKDNLHNL